MARMPRPQTPPPPRRPTSESIQPALAELVAAEVRAGARESGASDRERRQAAELDRRLRALCRLSHDAGLPVERVLVLMKTEWARAAVRRS